MPEEGARPVPSSSAMLFWRIVLEDTNALMPTKTPGDTADSTPDVGRAPSSGADSELIRRFVEHWGVMARAWGINASMGELFALLYVTGSDWTAEELRETLQVSRGNVSMNLRELIGWGVVHKVHRQGERREFYKAEADVWTLFRRILAERKRRELDPTLNVLRRTVREISDDPENRAQRDRLVDLQDFFALMNVLASRLITLDAAELHDLGILFAPVSESDPARTIQS
jgi:DNA-binding transcriptional regulator GbsR (MarR family)